jgi:CheY-like chemotaxis protein
MAAFLHSRHILLADDDRDDGLLFGDVLAAFHEQAKLTVVHDGEVLIRLLKDLQPIPDLLFLDLNMPLKNGINCLTEIKQDGQLQQMPVVIFSTSYEVAIINRLYAMGAHYYIRKPNDFTTLKNVIGQALLLTEVANNLQPPRDKFELLS